MIGLLAIVAAWSARPVEQPCSRFVLPVDTRAVQSVGAGHLSRWTALSPTPGAPKVAGRCHCTGWRTRRSASRRVRRRIVSFFSPDSAWLSSRRRAEKGLGARRRRRRLPARMPAAVQVGAMTTESCSPQAFAPHCCACRPTAAPETLTRLDASRRKRPPAATGLARLSRGDLHGGAHSRTAIVVASLETGERRLTSRGEFRPIRLNRSSSTQGDA